MTPTDLAVALRELPHFRTLPADLLERIASGSRLRTLASGETIFLERDPCRAFFAVRSGSVKLYRSQGDGREQVVHNLHAGATFAEAALLTFGRYPVSAIATETPTELLEIGGDAFLRLFREDDRLAPAMVASLSMWLVSLVERVEELSTVQAGQRLARWILRQPARTRPDGLEVELPMAKKELAAHLAMTPETLSRLLRAWQESGWIDSERALVRIRDAHSLLLLAEGGASP
jgi:CRP-like cAMP-binding protein